jgi:transposase
MAYLGMVPSEHSSGPKRCVGAITKAGDVHPSSGYSNGFAVGTFASLARTLLIETAHAYRFPARVARHKLAGIDAVPEAVRTIAWKAQTWLCQRYRQMMAKGKPRQVVVTAIARELAGFVWSIACITSDLPVKSSAVTTASDEVRSTAAVGRARHRRPLTGKVRRVGRPPTSQ